MPENPAFKFDNLMKYSSCGVRDDVTLLLYIGTEERTQNQKEKRVPSLSCRGRRHRQRGPSREGMIKGAPGDPGGPCWRSPLSAVFNAMQMCIQVEWDCRLLLFLSSVVTFSILNSLAKYGGVDTW
jgi:hypothetical protein